MFFFKGLSAGTFLYVLWRIKCSLLTLSFSRSLKQAHKCMCTYLLLQQDMGPAKQACALLSGFPLYSLSALAVTQMPLLDMQQNYLSLFFLMGWPSSISRWRGLLTSFPSTLQFYFSLFVLMSHSLYSEHEHYKCRKKKKKLNLCEQNVKTFTWHFRGLTKNGLLKYM